MKDIKGFTLVEMMVVVLIMALLAGISYPLYTKSINKSRVAEAISLVEIVREAQLSRAAQGLKYFDTFNNNHAQGNARLIKSGNVTVQGGALIKDDYKIEIMNYTGTDNDPEVKSGCIVVKYRDSGTGPMFTIYAHVEDNLIGCTDYSGNQEICNVIPHAEAGQNHCS